MERNDDDGDLGSGSREPRLAFPQVGKEPLLLPQRRSPGSMRPWDTAPLRMRRRGGVGEAEGGSPISTAPHVGVGVVATCGNRRETRFHADGATPGRVLRVVGPGQLSVWGLPWVPRAEFDGSQRLPEDNSAADGTSPLQRVHTVVTLRGQQTWGRVTEPHTPSLACLLSPVVPRWLRAQNASQ